MFHSSRGRQQSSLKILVWKRNAMYSVSSSVFKKLSTVIVEPKRVKLPKLRLKIWLNNCKRSDADDLLEGHVFKRKSTVAVQKPRNHASYLCTAVIFRQQSSTQLSFWLDLILIKLLYWIVPNSLVSKPSFSGFQSETRFDLRLFHIDNVANLF